MKIKLLSVVLLICVCLASCGQTSGGEAVGTTAPGTTDTDAPVSDVMDDNLPAADYKGRDFRILGASNDIPMVYVEELNGSMVNDSVYNANKTVEERFNIKLSNTVLKVWTDAAAIKSIVLSGSNDIEMGVCHDVTAGNLSLEGLFYDLYELQRLDFDKPWWPEFTVNEFTVNDKLYLISNYIGYNGLRGTKNMYVNLDKLNSYKMDSPYDAVKNGTWVLDKVIATTKGIYEDLDGSGAATRDDFYGFAFTGLFYGWLENFNIEAYRKDASSGELTLSLNNGTTVQLIDKLKGWLYGGHKGVYYKPSHTGLMNPDSYAMMFADGKCMFTYGSLYVLIDCLLKSEVTYGILPMPKYDEKQEDYLGVCYDSPMWVPQSITDTEYVGTITEAMSAEGYKQILPVYKDIALKNRYAVDKESSEMLDIIFANRWLSFSYIYGGDNGFQRILNTVIPSDTLNFASYYEANEGKELDRLVKLNEFFGFKA